MSTITETVTVEGDELTLSLIVWRRFMRPMAGMVEAILDANPGLASLGSILPLGTVFEMPVPVPQENQVLEPIRLW
jgi:phage tail protein X